MTPGRVNFNFIQASSSDIKNFNKRKNNQFFGITALALISLGFGSYLYHQHQKDQQTPAIPPKVITRYLSADTPEIPIKIIPPKYSPFSKNNSPKDVSLKLYSSFSDTLVSYGIPREQIENIEDSLKSVIDPRLIKKGTTIKMRIEKNDIVNNHDIDEFPHIVRHIEFKASPGIRVKLKGDGNHYTLNTIYDKIYERSYLASGKIRSSLGADAKRLGVPQKMISQFIKKFSLNVDFRELQRDDSFEFGFNAFYDEENNRIGTGQMNYASLTVNGKKNEIFYIPNSKGEGEWFNERGMNSKPMLMKTPIDGARLSSKFGMRRHPILGFNKLHSGIDFAAPTGTPIYAAGDGVIVQRYRSSSYGNYVKIKHTGPFETAYAHMVRFANLRQGQSVRQGQIIGYVGTTGRSTGPHLHYEVHKNGVPINPLSGDVPTVSTVTAQMKHNMQNIKKRISKLRDGDTVQTVYNSINEVKHKIK